MDEMTESEKDSACGSGLMFKQLRQMPEIDLDNPQLKGIVKALTSIEALRAIEEYDAVLKTRVQLTLTGEGSGITSGKCGNINNIDADVVITGSTFNQITIDTLHLLIPIHKISIFQENHLEIHPTRDGKGNFLLWRYKDGTPVFGDKAVCNRNGIFFEIKRLKRGWLDGNNVVCKIQLTFPSLVGQGNNLWPIHQTWFKYLLNHVQKEVQNMGVTLDIRKAKVVRCDLNRNISLAEPFQNYQDVLCTLYVPRTKMETYKKTGIRFRNNSRTINLYDKSAQMQGVNYVVPSYIARLEHQLKNARTVRQTLGLNTVEELEMNWDRLSSVFLSFVNSTFDADIAELRHPRPRSDQRYANPCVAQCVRVARWCQKNLIPLELSVDQLEQLIRTDINGVENFAKAIKTLPGMDPKYASRAIREMKKALLREQINNDPLFALRYRELADKFKEQLSRLPTEPSSPDVRSARQLNGNINSEAFDSNTGSYPSDLSDEQWRILAPALKRAARHSGHTPRREIVNAIFYVLNTNSPWRNLPNTFPHWKTVYSCFSRWNRNGVWETVSTVLGIDTHAK